MLLRRDPERIHTASIICATFYWNILSVKGSGSGTWLYKRHLWLIKWRLCLHPSFLITEYVQPGSRQLRRCSQQHLRHLKYWMPPSFKGSNSCLWMVEKQRLHLYCHCKDKSEHRFEHFTSRNRLVHSNHASCWIKAFVEVHTSLCEKALHHDNYFWTFSPPFPQTPKAVFRLGFFPSTTAKCSQVLQISLKRKQPTAPLSATRGLGQNSCALFKGVILVFWRSSAEPGAGLTDSYELPPTWDILWFYDSLLWNLGRETAILAIVTAEGPEKAAPCETWALVSSPCLVRLRGKNTRTLMNENFELWISGRLICPSANMNNTCKAAFSLPTAMGSPGQHTDPDGKLCKNRYFSTERQCN